MRRIPALLFCALLAVQQGSAETFLVLPFFNRTSQANLDWIGESIGENVREALAAEGALTTPREDRTEAYRRLSLRPYSHLTKASVIKIAETVGADQVVFGQFELEPNPQVATSRGTLRITADILDLRKIRKGPSLLAVGTLEDLATLQNHLAWQTLHFALPKTAPTEEEYRQKRPPVRVDAMENYIRGLGTDNEEQRHRFLTQAARLDTRFWQPCVEVARMRWKKQDYRGAVEWLDRAAAAGSDSREAVFMRGVARFYLADYALAQAAFEQVAHEVPLNEVFNNLGAAQSRLNNPAAVESFRKALEGDRNDPVYHFNLGYVLWKQGDFDAAADSLRQVLQRDPEDTQATTLLGRCLQRAAYRTNDLKVVGLERLKLQFEESAFLQLRSILEGGKKE